MHLRRISIVMALTLLVACGDDDDDAAIEETTTTTAAAEEEGGEFAEYCAAVAEIEGEDTAPTVEQMEAIRSAAPAEIETEVNTLVDRFLEAIETADFDSLFNDPELADEFDAVEAFEAENCPGGTEPAEGAAGEINPE